MPRWLKYASCALLVALGTVVAVHQTSAQSTRRSIDRRLDLPALGPGEMRMVPPTPRVRIDRDRGDEPRDRDSRRPGRELPVPPELTADGGFRSPSYRSTNRSTPTRPTRPTERSTSRTPTRSSSRSTSSSTAPSGASAQTFRRAVGDDPDDEGLIEYGRLIVMTQTEGVRVTIDGQPYPYGSMDGVLLYANEQYDVLLEQITESSSRTSSSATTARVISVRVGPGETRVLLANLGSGTASTPPRRSARDRRSRSRSRSRDDDDDDDEIGYLGVSSSPRGTVYVDDENTGQTTPARRIQLEPGRHEVRIFYESEERFSETKNVLIREGVNTNVFFRLRRDEDDEDD